MYTCDVTQKVTYGSSSAVVVDQISVVSVAPERGARAESHHLDAVYGVGVLQHRRVVGVGVAAVDGKGVAMGGV